MPAANSTRWNSLLRQVESILSKGLSELNAVSRETKHNECIFTQKEWDQLIELADILAPIKIYTDMLQGDQVSNSLNE